MPQEWCLHPWPSIWPPGQIAFSFLLQKNKKDGCLFHWAAISVCYHASNFSSLVCSFSLGLLSKTSDHFQFGFATSQDGSAYFEGWPWPFTKQIIPFILGKGRKVRGSTELINKSPEGLEIVSLISRILRGLDPDVTVTDIYTSLLVCETGAFFSFFRVTSHCHSFDPEPKMAPVGISDLWHRWS